MERFTKTPEDTIGVIRRSIDVRIPPIRVVRGWVSNINSRQDTIVGNSAGKKGNNIRLVVCKRIFSLLHDTWPSDLGWLEWLRKRRNICTFRFKKCSVLKGLKRWQFYVRNG